MKILLVVLLCIEILGNYVFANNYRQTAKEISDKAIDNYATFEDKVLALRKYVHATINKAPYIGAPKSNGNLMTQKEYYNLRDKERFRMSTIDKLNFGYGWCDDLAAVFMDLANKQNIKTRMVYLQARPPRKDQHTIAEALAPDGRWVIVDLDPSWDLVLTKNGNLVSRQQIKKDKSILYGNPTVKKLIAENPGSWGDENYSSMFYNNPIRILKYEDVSKIYNLSK